jgi:hypothetical protein
VNVTFYRGESRRSAIVCDAVIEGCRKHGVKVATLHEREYTRPDADVAVFYGLAGNLKRLQREYSEAGKAVFLDLGYWGRDEKGGVAGSHRVSVNGLHATAYFQRKRHSPDRFRKFGIRTHPFSRSGDRVVLCGMSAKAAWVYDYEPEAWECKAVQTLRGCTKRHIQYRPKPSWPDAKPIPGASWTKPFILSIDKALGGAWACVTHHSNAALDALIAGVPAFCEEGLASPLSQLELSEIDRPFYPDEGDRDQLLYDAAHTQYTISELADGTMWRYLRDEGLI